MIVRIPILHNNWLWGQNEQVCNIMMVKMSTHGQKELVIDTCYNK